MQSGILTVDGSLFLEVNGEWTDGSDSYHGSDLPQEGDKFIFDVDAASEHPEIADRVARIRGSL
jgi:hypothetical protein